MTAIPFTTIPVFSFLAPADAEKLQTIARPLSKAKGEVIVMRGEPVLGVYVVLEGEVGVYTSGATQPLVKLAPLEAFGEMSFLERTTASATIRAESKTSRLAVLMQSDLDRLVAADPLLGQMLFKGIALALSRKLRTTTDKMAGELLLARQLLAELAAEMPGSADATVELPKMIEEHGAQLAKSLEETEHKIDDIVRKTPERAGTLAGIAKDVGAARAAAKSFYPKLARQLVVTSRFIGAIQKLVSASNA